MRHSLSDTPSRLSGLRGYHPRPKGGGKNRPASGWAPNKSGRPYDSPFPEKGADAAFRAPKGGAWIWMPQGFEPKKPWRKRHPVLFWGGILVLLAFIFNWGRLCRELRFPGEPKIAVVNVEGVLYDAKSVLDWISEIHSDTSYKGAIVRINSPGGAVGPSQEIYAALNRLAEKMPVAASMGALAASGGYYAAIGADRIFASPSTLTASIGVKMQVPNVEGLMRTLGISEKTLTTGGLKDAGSSWRAMTPEEQAYLQGLLDDMYKEFIETVARERDLSLDEVRLSADGRAMTGRQALEAKLVDELGDLHDATQWVIARANLDEHTRLVEGPEKNSSFFSPFFGALFRLFWDKGLEGTEQRPVFFY